jgi:hypothetical protein
MLKKRLNIEKKIGSPYFKLKIGSVNRNNPKAVYIDGRAFVKPNEEADDYNYSITVSKKEFKTALYRELLKSNLFDRRFIMDFDIAKSGIKLNKYSFLSFQIFLKQKLDIPMAIKKLKPLMEPFVLSITNELNSALVDNGFTVSKKKG